MIKKKSDPTIKKVPITLSTKGVSENQKRDMVDAIGYTPIIYYNGYHIQNEDIKFFDLDNTGFYPTLSVRMKDSLGITSDKAFPLDNTKISIFINPRSDIFEPIHCDFKILDFQIYKKEEQGNIVTITGVLDVDYLYLQKSYSIPKSTSYKALEKIATEAELGFASNINSTSDSMTWINPGEEGYNFINHIVERSYISDSSFLYAFVDNYYYLNYVDVEVALEQDITNQKNITNLNLTNDIGDKATLLILTNDQSVRDSNTYFDDWKILNQSTKNALKYGHRRRVHYYDRSGNWADKAGSFLVFDMDTITTPGAEEKSVILKGAPKDQNFFKDNLKNIYVGKLDKDNMHVQAPYAYAQNSQNLIDVQKVVLEIHMPTPNFLLYRYQKVQVIISNQGTTPTQAQVNNRLSGHWLITGITYKYSAGQIGQTVTLVKRELNDGVVNQ